jgi:HSP20 family protein
MESNPLPTWQIVGRAARHAGCFERRAERAEAGLSDPEIVTAYRTKEETPMLTLTHFRPARPEVSAFENHVNRLVNETLGNFDWAFRDSATAAWVPPVDVLEQPDAIRINLEIPGVNPDQVSVSVEGNTLTISGTKEQVAEEKTERVHRYERTYGAFERTFTLPASVDAGAIKATADRGVLTVTLPKVEKAKPRTIAVETK